MMLEEYQIPRISEECGHASCPPLKFSTDWDNIIRLAPFIGGITTCKGVLSQDHVQTTQAQCTPVEGKGQQDRFLPDLVV